jgi:hypothetical protein
MKQETRNRVLQCRVTENVGCYIYVLPDLLPEVSSDDQRRGRRCTNAPLQLCSVHRNILLYVRSQRGVGGVGKGIAAASYSMIHCNLTSIAACASKTWYWQTMQRKKAS